MPARVAQERPFMPPLGRGYVVVASPSVHLRLDVRSAMRGMGVDAHLLKSLRQLQGLSAHTTPLGVIVDAQLLPTLSRRDHWTKALLTAPGTYVVHCLEEARSAAEALALAARR